MATTTDGGDDSRDRISVDVRAAERIAQLTALQHENAQKWAAGQNVVQTAGEVNNVFIATLEASGHVTKHDPKPSLAEQRQKFHFDVLKLKMTHAQWMIFISVFAVAFGVVALIIGAAMALANTGSTHGYVTAASGLAASLGGGALHRHAKHSMADLTDAAKRNEDKVDADYELEAATTFIDRVQDQGAKDRLNAAAALKAMNIQPNADTMFNRLLPGDPPREIEPGAPNN